MGAKLTIKVTQGKAYICLSESQCYTFVFQLLGKLLQFFCGKILLKRYKKNIAI